MSKVKIQGNASGTGVLTVTAPNTSTDRTITLPDATGTLLNSDGSGANLTGLPNGSQLDHSGTKKIEAVSTGAQIQNRLEVITPNDSSTHLVQRLGSTDGSYGYVDLELVSPNSTAASLPRLDVQIGNSTVASFIRGGGIALGGTGAANTLDDYEEGTHTVTVTMGTGTVALHSNHRTFQYTKIGRVVHISGQVLIDSANSEDGEFQMTLPFTVGNGASFYSVGNYRTYNVDTPNDGVQAVVFANSNEAKCNFAWSRDAATPTNERATVNGFYMIGLTYMT